MSLLVTESAKLTFDGASIPSLNDLWSISFWYYHHTDIGAGGAYRTIFAHHSDAFVNFLALTVSGSTILLWRFDVAAVGNIAGGTISTGWHHIQVRNVDNVSAELYIDGALAVTCTHAAGTFVPNATMSMAWFGADASFALYDETASQQARIEDIKIVLGDQPPVVTLMASKFPMASPAIVSWVPLVEGQIGTEEARDLLGYGDWSVTNLIYDQSAPQSYGAEMPELIWPAPQTLSPGGIASGEALGTPALQHVLRIGRGGASEEAFGTPTLAHRLVPGGIASSEALGAPALALRLSPAGIGSEEALGTPSLQHVLAIPSIASEEGVGAPSLAPAISPPGIASGEALGTPALALTLAPGGIASAEGLGNPVLSFFVAEATVAMTLMARRGQVSAPGRIGASINRRATAGGVDLELQAGPTQLHSLHAGHVGGTAEKI